jgi:hypothetical protein
VVAVVVVMVVRLRIGPRRRLQRVWNRLATFPVGQRSRRRLLLCSPRSENRTP